MKKKIIRINILVAIAALVSLTFSNENYFLKLDKKVFKKDEMITGKACLNSDAMKAITDKRDKGYIAYDDAGHNFSNAVQLRIAPAKKDRYSREGYLTIQNSITVKNDSAFISFKVPESLIKGDKAQTMQLKVSRTWKVRGRDTTFVAIKQFEIF